MFQKAFLVALFVVTTAPISVSAPAPGVEAFPVDGDGPTKFRWGYRNGSKYCKGGQIKDTGISKFEDLSWVKRKLLFLASQDNMVDKIKELCVHGPR
jgi:hypothetical protein